MADTVLGVLLADIAQPSTLAETIARIRRAILDGELVPGRSLPSERSLAGRFGVSRTVVRAALSGLEAEGLVVRGRKCVRRVGAVSAPAAERLSADVSPSASPPPPSLLSQTVVIVSDIDPASLRADGAAGWSWSIYRGAAEAIIETGRGVLPVPDAPASLEHFAWMASTPPCGVVVLSAPPPYVGDGRALLTAMHLGDRPVAAYGDDHDWPGCATVVSDHAEGSRLLVDWLAARGRRRILRYGHRFAKPVDWPDRRREGYERACREHGLPALPPCFAPSYPGSDRSEAAFDAQAHMTAGYLYPRFAGDGPPDAIMAMSDAEVPEIVAACRLLGRVPGRDVDVVGYDHYWRECKGRNYEPTPPAATIDKQNVEIGRALVRQLWTSLDAPAASPAPIVVPPKLVAFA